MNTYNQSVFHSLLFRWISLMYSNFHLKPSYYCRLKKCFFITTLLSGRADNYSTMVDAMVLVQLTMRIEHSFLKSLHIRFLIKSRYAFKLNLND